MLGTSCSEAKIPSSAGMLGICTGKDGDVEVLIIEGQGKACYLLGFAVAVV
ncbi:MAG: hypothetical protein MUO68_02205 [Desulfobacteraceae bacterium]|nr:hypothetical protein [Desulfobacteraceae bacterium]